jgi:hypothetical protein
MWNWWKRQLYFGSSTLVPVVSLLPFVSILTLCVSVPISSQEGPLLQGCHQEGRKKPAAKTLEVEEVERGRWILKGGASNFWKLW